MWSYLLAVVLSLGVGISSLNLLTYLVLVSTENARNSGFLDEFYIDLT